MSNENQANFLYDANAEAIPGTTECRVAFVPNFIDSKNPAYSAPDAIAIVDIGEAPRFVRWERESNRAQFISHRSEFENQALQAADRFIDST